MLYFMMKVINKIVLHQQSNTQSTEVLQLHGALLTEMKVNIQDHIPKAKLVLDYFICDCYM